MLLTILFQSLKGFFVDGCRTNQLDGHVNLRDAASGQCSFKDPKSGKQYSLKKKVPSV